MSSPLPQSPVANLAAVPHWLNLANLLTLSRLVLAFVLFGLMAFEMWIVSLGVFGVAAFTDWLDGYVARRQGLVSSLGRVLDPLVDKVLICGAFVFLCLWAPKKVGYCLGWSLWLLPANSSSQAFAINWKAWGPLLARICLGKSK